MRNRDGERGTGCGGRWWRCSPSCASTPPRGASGPCARWRPGPAPWPPPLPPSERCPPPCRERCCGSSLVHPPPPRGSTTCTRARWCQLAVFSRTATSIELHPCAHLSGTRSDAWCGLSCAATRAARPLCINSSAGSARANIPYNCSLEAGVEFNIRAIRHQRLPKRDDLGPRWRGELLQRRLHRPCLTWWEGPAADLDQHAAQQTAELLSYWHVRNSLVLAGHEFRDLRPPPDWAWLQSLQSLGAGARPAPPCLAADRCSAPRRCCGAAVRCVPESADGKQACALSVCVISGAADSKPRPARLP